MGLSNSKDIITEFNGTIVYSNASGNTEFTITLPCKEEVKEETKEEKAS
jgi:signal transduction histidine kinase